MTIHLDAMRNIEKTCRFCLNSLDEFGVDIFWDDNGFSLANDIKNILVFQFEDTPNWPRNACLDCVDVLMQIRTFQDLITSSHDTLKREEDLAEITLTTETIFDDNLDVYEVEISEPETLTEQNLPDTLDIVLENEPPPCFDNSEIDKEQQIELEGLSMDGISDIVEDNETEEVEDTSTTGAEYDFVFPILEHDAFLKLQDEMQKDEPLAMALQNLFKTTQLKSLFGIDILREYSVSGYQNKIKISSSPLFTCVANSWVTDTRSYPVALANIEEQIRKALTKPPAVEPIKYKFSRESKELQEIGSSTSGKLRKSEHSSPSIVRYPNPPQSEEEEKLEKVMVEMKLFVCKTCDLNCEVFPKLRDHVKTEHPSELKSYEICCQKTLGAINFPGYLYDHIRLHLDRQSFKCSECGKCLDGRQNLKTHMLRMHSNGTVPAKFVCQICGKGFPTFSTFNDHQRTNHRKYKCGYCPAELATAFTYRNHVQKQHENVVNVMCEICGKGYPSNSQLRTHINDHGGPHGGRRKKKPKAPKVDLPYDSEYFEKNRSINQD